MRRAQVQAIRPASTQKPAAARKLAGSPRRAAASNHLQAGPAGDLANIVQQARTAPRAQVPHAAAVARDFGLSLSALEIHAGEAAAAACRLIDARAFAIQNLVVFANPRPSLSLVRHEFAHVRQQDGIRCPAPARYEPGSIRLGPSGSEVEREADAAAAGHTNAVHRGAPVAVQREDKNDEDKPVTAATEAKKRLVKLASVAGFALKTLKAGEAPHFGVSKDINSPDPTFNPAFLRSSENSWTLEDYIAANPVENVTIDKRRARYELSDHVFKRGSGGKLNADAIARTAFSIGNSSIWTSRAVPQDIDTKTADLRTTRYVFLGACQFNNREINPKLGDENPRETVNERGRYERDNADPVESLNSYIDIVGRLVTIAKKKKKKKALTGADEVKDAIKALKPMKDAGKGREKLRDWVLKQYTGIDEFFALVIHPEGFPKNWNPIKGDLQARFIAKLRKGGSATAAQVYFGEEFTENENLKVKPSGELQALRRGDGYIKVGNAYHILESKARTSPPSDEEIEQMKDYKRIITPPRIKGYLLSEGNISRDMGEFTAVEYYLAISTIPVKGDPLYKLAEAWTTELDRAFIDPKKKPRKPEGYRIHPNLSGDPAKKTTIKINPLIELPIPNPDQVEQKVENIPKKLTGANIKRADFKLAQIREAEIASGSILIALDLGDEVKSGGEPKPQAIHPMSDGEAGSVKEKGAVIYGHADNNFDNLTTSLDSFFNKRVSADARLTDAGVEGTLDVAPGPSGIRGITVGAKVTITYGKKGLTAHGRVDLSNQEGTIKGAIAVTYDNSGGQWNIVGDVTVTDIVEGLEPFKANFTCAPKEGTKKVHADKVGIKKKYGGITISGIATNLDLDANTGAFSGSASLFAQLGAFGEASAENVVIEANQIKNATLVYKTPTLAYPKTNPALSGMLKGAVTYTAGQKPGDQPLFGGSIEVDAAIDAAPLKRLTKDGKLGVKGKVEIDDGKFVRSTIGTTDTLKLGKHFQIPRFHADVDEKGAIALHFTLQVIDIGPLKDASVDATVDQSRFHIDRASGEFAFGSDKDKVWGSLRIRYEKDDLTVGGKIHVRIKEGLVASGDAYYDNKKETVTASLSVEEITLLRYGPKEHSLVDLSKQVELISFYEVVGLYLDVGFNLAFSYSFDLRLRPAVTLEDFSFKTFEFARARARMQFLGELAATLTATPNVGLGVFIISTKLLRGGGGIAIPITGRAALALKPPVTVEVVYTPEGGISAGGEVGLTLLFGVTGAVLPYADFSVLNGTYENKWKGDPLTSFVLLKERPIFTYVVNFGNPLTTETKPPIPEKQENPPKIPNTEHPITAKADGKATPSEVRRKEAQEKKPEDKPKADNKGGFDLASLVAGLKNEPSFAKAFAILDAAAQVWDAISGFVGAIVNFVRKWVGGTIDLIVGIIKAMGKHNVAGYLKEFLGKRIDPLLFHILEPLLDAIGAVEQDLYDLFELELPSSPWGIVDFVVTIIKKVLKLAWSSFFEFVSAIKTMVERAIEGTRDFAQYLVKAGRLGVIRRERYIGSETLHLEKDFLVADEYKIDVGGVKRHELSDSILPSPDKAIGFALWHALDMLKVEPTTSSINADTGDAYADYWSPLPVDRGYNLNRKVRGAGTIATSAQAALEAAVGDSGVALPSAIRRRYESALGTDLSEIRLHTGAASAVAAQAIDARAYTVGRNIHFDVGEYAPETAAGEQLLAHELTHAAWSPRAERKQYGFRIAPASDPSERKAETMAQANASI
ncbi:DUF4157 domain-containing protein [Dyella humicola]|uniref:eCIS core domain-containing protein n=1 Tax=Dyella humicola TaxID=2992126 RepID=UPI00224F7AEE|nr:DUF4157 domain-containing protein [Dyella humicola]